MAHKALIVIIMIWAWWKCKSVVKSNARSKLIRIQDFPFVKQA